jgi:uncharacterized membrane protein YfcA
VDPIAWAGLGALAFATSLMTAVVGLGGGIVLLTVMLLWFDPLVAIPLHGAVQVVSNSSRAYIHRRHVDAGILARFSVLLLPAGIAGLLLAQELPAEGIVLAIGVFVLLATWAPRVLLFGMHPDRLHPRRRFYALGGVIGFLNVTIGATGPLQGPFFLNLGLPRQGVIGNFAACQTTGHLVKIALFGAAGFAFGSYVWPLLALAGCVIAGTWVGSLLLERVNERAFTWIYRGVLTAVALRLVLVDGLALLGVQLG